MVRGRGVRTPPPLAEPAGRVGPRTAAGWGENREVSDQSDGPFQHRSFVLFWYSRIASGFAFQMLAVAVGWQIYKLTGSALNLGLIGLVQFFPSVLLALPAGHLADHYDRRKVVLYAQLVELLTTVGLALISLGGQPREAVILALVAVNATAKAFEWPASSSLLPALVPLGILPRAMALNGSAGQAAMIVGPALGGLLYIWGPSAVYGTAGLLYLVSTWQIGRLRYDHTPPPREPATLASLFAGVRFIRARPDVLGVISLDLFAVLLGGATALLPIFASDILHTGSVGLGVLRAAPAVGALLMSVRLARNTLERNVGMVMFAAVAGFGVATIVFALSRTMWLSLMALFALGAFDMVSMVIRGSLVQLDTPDEMRGRVNAVNSIFINTSNQLGEFESGLLAAAVGAVGAALIGGVGTLAVVGLWMTWFPTLRARQSLAGQPRV